MKISAIKILVILSLFLGSAFFVLRVLQYQSLFSFEWEDDARHNQTVYNIATSFTPHQTIYQNQPPRFLNNHFSPLYFLIALFYKIFPHVFTWYFLLCFSYSFTSVVVYLLAKNILGDDKSAFIISLIYLCYPPLHYAVLGALHTGNFTLPFIFLSLYFLTKKMFPQYMIFMCLSNFCRDDISLYFILLGICLCCLKYPGKWWKSTLLFSCVYLIFAAVITRLYCSVTIRDRDFISYNYIDMGTLVHVLKALFLDTRETMSQIFMWEKMRFFIMLLYPLLFLPLTSIISYVPISIPLLVMGLRGGFFNSNSYYVAPIIPFVFTGFIFSLHRIKTHIKRMETRGILFILKAVFIFCFMSAVFMRNIIGRNTEESWKNMNRVNFISAPNGVEYIPEVCDNRFRNLTNVFDPRLYTRDLEDKQAWELINMIPRHASVTATGDLLLALSSRRYLYEFALNLPVAFENELHFEEYQNYDVDYILINKKCKMNGISGNYPWLFSDDLEKEIQRLVYFYNFMIKETRGSFVLLQKIEK